MANFLVNEKRIVNSNVSAFESRLNSQFGRFLDSAPTFTDYWHVNNVESTADLGFQGIDRIIGDSSPIRYSFIKDLPIYGIEQILLELTREEHGIDTSYAGEGIIIPDTIIPTPNDVFAISYLDHNFLFIVDSIAYDTIKSNNYYKIQFSLKSTDVELAQIMNQVTEEYECILTNIGTTEKALIRSDEMVKLQRLNEVYTLLAERYKVFFYDDRHNTFLYQDQYGNFIYDKYLSEFINTTELFNERTNYRTLFLSTERKDTKFIIEYYDSIYSTIMRRNKKQLIPQFYAKATISDINSTFVFYSNKRVMDTILNIGTEPYVPLDLFDAIEKGKLPSGGEGEFPIMYDILVKFFNGELTNIDDLDISGLEDMRGYFLPGRLSFILIPLVMYVMKSLVSVHMKK